MTLLPAQNAQLLNVQTVNLYLLSKMQTKLNVWLALKPIVLDVMKKILVLHALMAFLLQQQHVLHALLIAQIVTLHPIAMLVKTEVI